MCSSLEAPFLKLQVMDVHWRGRAGEKWGERVRQMDGFSVRSMEKGRGVVGCREEGK